MQPKHPHLYTICLRAHTEAVLIVIILCTYDHNYYCNLKSSSGDNIHII